MKRLNIKAERCAGCKRCETACMAEHNSNVPRIFVESVSERPVPVVCRHCEEPLCVSACMAGCMQKDPVTGIVTNTGHEQKCVGCWMCVMACPYGVIVPNGGLAEKCDMCPNRDTPACVEACPNYVISLDEMSCQPTGRISCNM